MEIHQQGIIYRDLKPDNLLVGIHDPSKIFIVDFGLAKYYLEPKKQKEAVAPPKKEETKRESTAVSQITDKKKAVAVPALPRTEHIPQCDGKSLVGTPRYASLHSHMGHEQSRRDDLESLAYMLVYLHNGVLPWSGLREPNKQLKYLNIKNTKESCRPDELCHGMPPVFTDFLIYVKNLEFTQVPDYKTWISAFESSMSKNSLKSHELPWIPLIKDKIEKEKNEKKQILKITKQDSLKKVLEKRVQK